ncbi:serine hydrolase domain-containing protein [Flavilitoribacter nigricans]|uniref:Serine hydrolase n=1 Tax=Flavilitoribacter nigricans (strain ATCC 23147 / DSM 23189 / NBRC 102662 / NCIMB 1420 / SS-2) TaxID=1122177 RepID=A0A2D0N8Q6_FLAN2|nr:serine hydrolase domain-containing protein [Flavilitoribacter nigricans]PHN04892.1 serine hydrolase [Flavilitoribacter nigricans DSM 23189 = NBRC 102662]
MQLRKLFFSIGIGTTVGIVLSLLACNAGESTSSFAEKVNDLLTEELGAGGPGGAVLILKNDEVVFSEGYGTANLETGEVITTKTLFNLGSISKTFVSNGILLLQERGKLSVEDPLSAYFPDFAHPEIAQKIKISHLLTHTSGLPDNRQVSRDPEFYLTAKDEENWAPELLVDSLNFAPGTNYQYSNPAFNGLALIIEQVSGQKWQDFIIENIIRPSGMASSTITDGPHPESGVAHAYVQGDGGQWAEDDYGEEPTFAAAGNGGVWSTVEELARYEQALRAAVFLPAAVIENSRTPKNDLPVKALSCLEDRTWNLGYSWFISQTDSGVKLVGHSGTQGGFYANYIAVPDQQILFVMLANFPCDRQKISLQIMQWIEEELFETAD